jgi:uncharacterized membrane protein
MKPDTSSRKRTVVKGLSFEIVSNLAGLGLAYAVFGNFGSCAVFTLVCFVVKLILFYYHERIWHQFDWGKQA